MKRVVFLTSLFLLPVVSVAANRVRYVDTGAVAGGDGTTSAVSGANAAYVDLQKCIVRELAADADLSDEGWLVIHCNRTNGGGVDANNVNITGFTQGDYGVSILQDDFPSDGIWSDSAYSLAIANGAALTTAEPTILTNFQLTNTDTAGVDTRGIVYSANLTIDSCIIRGQASGDKARGVSPGASGLTLIIVNSVIYGWVDGADADFIAIYIGANGTINIYNSTVVGNYIGIQDGASPTITIKNSYFGNTDDFVNTINVIDYVVSNEDITGFGGYGGNYWHLPTAGSGDYSSDFENAASGDFRLKGTASACLNTGVSQPSGGSTYDFDIIDTVRPQGAAWDIGAYERESSIPIIVYYQED